MLNIEKVKVISTDISICTYESIISLIKNNINDLRHQYICVCNVFSIMTAFYTKDFCKILNKALIATPDGMPVVWGLNGLTGKKNTRVDGPSLLLKCCEESGRRNLSLFFYGSTQETLTKLEKNLRSKFKDIQISGMYSPPFRELTKVEDDEIVEMITKSKPDLVFVGLGAPKQEVWMYQHKQKINSLMIGVGAAFDYSAGNINRASSFIQKCGLEWVYRLIQQPRRNLKKYLFNNPAYIYLLLAQIIKFKIYNGRLNNG